MEATEKSLWPSTRRICFHEHITLVALLILLLQLGVDCKQQPPPSRTGAPPPTWKPPSPAPTPKLRRSPPLPPSPRPPPSPSFSYAKNGIRLVGGNKQFGRLEVSSKNAWFARASGVGWRPVCDDGSVTPDVAKDFCRLLGYSFGQTVRLAGLNSVPVESWSGAVGELSCYYDDNGASAASLDPASGPLLRGNRRSLLHGLRYGSIDIPAAKRYKCSFYAGYCGSGDLVALQCSNANMPPAPPPPPRPPYPPGSPPSNRDEIQVYGSGQGYRRYVEANLCPQVVGSDSWKACRNSMRAELLATTAPSGVQEWAPLCAPANLNITSQEGGTWGRYVAYAACTQWLDWHGEMHYSEIKYVWADVLEPLTLPNKNVPAPPPPPSPSAGAPPQDPSDLIAFNVTSYQRWANLPFSPLSKAPYSLQELGIEFKKSPCASGRLFAFMCYWAVE